jgi:hypothetical protein
VWVRPTGPPPPGPNRVGHVLPVVPWLPLRIPRCPENAAVNESLSHRGVSDGGLDPDQEAESRHRVTDNASVLWARKRRVAAPADARATAATRDEFDDALDSVAAAAIA